MNARIRFSIFIIGLGIIVAFVPFKHNHPNQLKPSALLQKSIDESYLISVDKLAKSVVDQDSSIQIIDLRSNAEFKQSNIPGAVNIPYHELLSKEFEPYFEQKNVKNIFYSNGEIISSQAWTLCSSIGYQNVYILKGGLNEWFESIMNSNFSGERITAKENALFETRFKARKLFNEMNSMPDSLKLKFFELKKKNTKKLDGGCG